jgi:hypothetical protein
MVEHGPAELLGVIRTSRHTDWEVNEFIFLINYSLTLHGITTTLKIKVILRTNVQFANIEVHPVYGTDNAWEPYEFMEVLHARAKPLTRRPRNFMPHLYVYCLDNITDHARRSAFSNGKKLGH